MEESEPYISIRTPTEWQEAAACSNRPYEWFELPDRLTVRVAPQVRSDLAKGLEVCRGCPVAAECLADATREDKRWTIRGAVWPSAASQTPVGRPPVQRRPKPIGRPQGPPARLGVGWCKRGHDLAVTGLDGAGKCLPCRRTRQYYARHGLVRPILTPVWEFMDKCPSGHDLGPVEDRSGAFCVVCQRERKMEESRRRHQAKSAA